MSTTRKLAIKAFQESQPVVLLKKETKPSPPGSFLGLAVATAAMCITGAGAQTNVPSTNTDVAVFAGVAVATTVLIVGLGVGCAIRQVLIKNCESAQNRVTPI